MKFSYNYNPIKIGAIRFQSRSKAVIYMLKNFKNMTHTAIAKKAHVSIPCVSQLVPKPPKKPDIIPCKVGKKIRRRIAA